MRHHRSIIVVAAAALLFFSAVGGDLRGENQGKPDLMFGYVFGSRPDVEIKDAEAALKVWSAELGRKVNHTVESVFYEKAEPLIRDIESGRIDLASISVIDYLRAERKTELEVAFTHVVGEKNTKKYLLLVRNDNGAVKMADLRKKKMSILKGDPISKVFLDTLLYRQGLGNMTSFFYQVEERMKPSQVVLPVLFGQSDACVIADTFYNTVVEMNPQVGKVLKPIASTPELVDTVLIFRRSYRQDLKEKASRILDQMNGYPKGKQILTLFKIDDLIPISDSGLSSTRAFLAEHDRLKMGGLRHVVRSGP